MEYMKNNLHFVVIAGLVPGDLACVWLTIRVLSPVFGG